MTALELIFKGVTCNSNYHLMFISSLNTLKETWDWITCTVQTKTCLALTKQPLGVRALASFLISLLLTPTLRT